MISTHIALGDVVDVIAGQHIEARLYHDRPVGTPYLTGPADFGEVKPRVTKWTSAPKIFASSLDVLVTVKGAGVGKSNLGCDAAIGRQLMALRPRSGKVLQNYLYHFIRFKEREIARSADGATVPGIGKEDLTSLQMPRHSIIEQRRIAAILDKADALRRKRKRAIEVVGDAHSALVSCYLDTPRKVDLGDVILEGPTNGLYKPATAYGEGTPILRINNFYDGMVVDLSALRRLKVDAVELGRYQLSVGNIVINRVNSLEYLGKSALIDELYEPTVYESNMMRLSLDTSRILPDVCIALLQTSDVKQQILGMAKNAVNQSSINQRDVKSIRLPLPSMDKQTKFAITVKALKLHRQRLQNSLCQAALLFSSLQHRAFSGQL